MDRRIFYSWQSDSAARINRDFIQGAIQTAIDRIFDEDRLLLDPVIDRDTQNSPGSPAIADTILQKISSSAIFIADVTIITEGKRPSPNPNVLIELGYAAGTIGWNRIVCVMNEQSGGPSKLPFDLKHRRWPIRYKLAPSATDPRLHEKKAGLSAEIEAAIRSILTSGVLKINIDPKDKRVALGLEQAVNRFTATLAQFLRVTGHENEIASITGIYPNVEGNDYPARSVVENALRVLESNTLLTDSSTFIGDRALSWAEVVANDLITAAADCDTILNRYAERDDLLIDQLEKISTRYRMVASMIMTCVNEPSLRKLYENGIPDVHREFFEYMLLESLKSRAVAHTYY